MLKQRKKLFLFILFIFTVFAVTGCTQSDVKLEEVFNGLFEDIDLTAVDSDLIFLKSVEDVSISYVSDNSEVITNDGQITRGLIDQSATVYITLQYKNEKLEKTIDIVVLKDHYVLVNKIHGDLFQNKYLTNVTEDLYFPNLVDGVSISYNSENKDVLTNEGKIIRGTNDQKVNVDLTFTIEEFVLNKRISITILKDNNLFITEVYDNLFTGINLSQVTSDLSFPTLLDGVTISYQSNNTSVITNTGQVTRGTTDQNVVVNITLSMDGEVVKKTINVTVLKDPSLVINQVYSSLFTSLDLTKLSSNLNFVNNKDGVNISYVSDNTEVIKNNGEVVRGSEDKQVKITVTLSLDKVTVVKEVFVTVLKQENITYPILNAVNAGLNQSVTIQGIIIGKVGNNYYIHDGKDGIYLYLLGTGYSVGDEVRLTGVRIDYKGLKELKDFTNITKIRSGAEVPVASHVEYLLEILKQSTLYSIDNLEIVEYDNVTSGRDIFITVKDGMSKTMEIIISKYTDSTEVSKIANKLVGMTVGDKISLTNVVSTYYSKFQIQVFSADQILVEPSGGGAVVTDPIDPYFPRSEDMRFLNDELDEFLTSGVSPAGEANVLIIPINFTDYVISASDLSRLQTAFFGTSAETGWESVKTYYEKSSYGKFSFTGQILSPFETNKPSTYYAELFNNEQDADYEIIKAAMDYYDDSIDFSLYDNNNDGYIDGLYFIYATPTWYNEDTGSENDSDLWWAYVYQYYTEEYEYYDGVEANYYLWAGIDFMDEVLSYDEFTDEYININASTYIHETGHMLGLYDYYDYEKEVGPKGGLGGADMMDYTVGDHNSFSKIMLDWVTPLVVSGKSTTVTLNSFTTSGDVILVSTDWNNSYFDEYFLIEFFTPTGLNEAHAGFNGLYTTKGIRIFHVNASINADQTNGELFIYNNSNTSKKILKPVEADNDNSIETSGVAEDTDLFQVGDEFGSASYYRLSNGSIVNFNIKVLSMTDTTAQIEIIWANN